MKKEILYKILVLILLTVNITLISFFLFKKKPKRNFQKNNKPNAKELLSLTSEQNNSFREFSKVHHNIMVTLQNEQKQAVKEYFLAPSDSLLIRVSNIESKKIKTTEKHFNTMKSVLKEEQLERFEEFKRKALKYILK